MKKVIKVIISIFIVLALCVCGYYFYNLYSNILPNGNLTSTANLYKYDIFDNNENVLSIKIDGKYIYYIVSTISDNKSNYKLVKYNLVKNTKVKEYKFNVDDMYSIDIEINDNVFVFSKNLGDIFEFDKDLNAINIYNQSNSNYIKNNYYYGLYNSKVVMAFDNKVYYDNKLFDEIEEECGDVSDIINNKNDTYIYYYDYNTNLSCLYNVKNKTTKHLLSNNLELFDEGIFYNLYSDSIIHKVDNKNESKIILDNTDELINYSVDDNGEYILTQNNNNSLQIYNTNKNKLYYYLKLESSDTCFVESINIDKYAYYLRSENDKYLLYIWNYKKDRIINKDLSNKSDIDYRFENTKLIKKLNETYNIDIFAYDSSVRYFNDFYALPENNDKVINKSLLDLQDILKNFNKEFFDNFKTLKNKGLKIYLNKEVGPSDLSTQISNPAAYSSKIGKDYIIAININEYGFKNNFLHELMHSIENNMYDLYNGSKISFYPFENWNDYNPNGFQYEYSYVTEANNKYTTSQKDKVYFIDTYAKKYPNEDRARIFEHICDDKETNVLLQYSNLKNKMLYLKSSIIKAYPSLSKSTLFDILK